MLEAEGYYVGNLWHISDVQMNFDCTERLAIYVVALHEFNNLI